MDAEREDGTNWILPEGQRGFLNWDIAECFGYLPALFLQRVYFLQCDKPDNHEVRRSVYRLARDLRCSERGLWKVIRRLQFAGVITRQRSKDGETGYLRVNVEVLRAQVLGSKKVNESRGSELSS